MEDPGPPRPDADQAEFIRLLTKHHNKLLGYLVSLVGHWDDAEDVLQKSSLTMWRRFGTFTPGSDFPAWATRVAFYEAKNFLRASGRSRVTFSDALLDMLDRERAADVARQDARLEAVMACVDKLDEAGRDLIRRAYLDGADVAALAARMARAPQTIHNRLHLLRKAVAECVDRRLAGGGVS